MGIGGTFPIGYEHNLPRVREKHQDGTSGLHRLSWRTLWPLSRIQHHLFCRDNLLVVCQGVENDATEEKVVPKANLIKTYRRRHN